MVLRQMRFRDTVLIPAGSRARASCRALCSNSSQTSSAAQAKQAPNGGGPTETGINQASAVAGATRKKAEWRPSEAHRVSATSVHRMEAKAGSVQAKSEATRIASKAGAVSTSPGLRRRILLGGAEDASHGLELPSSANAARGAVAGLRGSALLANGGEGSVASSSATQRFRERRGLERLAAAGNTEAAEALRAIRSTSGSRTPVSGGTSSAGAGGSGHSNGGPSSGGGFFTPLNVLPILFVLGGTGYCILNDLLPFRLVALGGDGRGAPRRDSNVADGRDTERRELALLPRGEGANAAGARDHGSQLQQLQPRLPSAPTPAGATLPSDGRDPGKYNREDGYTTTFHRASRSTSNGGRGDAGLASQQGWTGRDGPRTAGRGGGEGEGVSEANRRAANFGAGVDNDSSRAEVGQQPLWLQRSRAPSPSRSP